MSRPTLGPSPNGENRDFVTWDLVPAVKALRSPATVSGWTDLLDQRPTAHRIYQSPDWFERVATQCGPDERAVLAVAHAGDGIRGLAPLVVGPERLRFQAAGRTFGGSDLTKVSILGGRPLLPECPALHDGLFHALDAGFPGCDAVGLSSVVRDTFLWNYLHTAPAVRAAYLPHLIHGFRRSYAMSLPPRFADYLAGLGRKRRYNAGRQLRLLRQHAGGDLQFHRVDDPAGVPEFVAAYTVVARAARPRADILGAGAADCWLASDARRGFLCSYLLRCRSEPVAAIFGYRRGSICHVKSTVYSPAYARFSPGAVLLHLVIEDLIGRGVRRIDFGVGNPAYGHSSVLTVREEASVLLWRKTLANRARRVAHAGFRTSAAYLRRAAVGIGLWDRPAPAM